MTADTAAAVSAIAAAVSAALTMAIAAANFAVARTEGSAADFDSCINVVVALGEAQRRVFRVLNNPVKWQFEFRELLNLMEALALLENERRTTRSTRKIAVHFLQETYAYLMANPTIRSFLESCVTGDETFHELAKFARKHKRKIAILIERYSQDPQAEPQAGSPPEN